MADVNELRILHRFHIVRLVRTSGLQKPASLVGIALAPLSVSLSLGKGLNFSVPQFPEGTCFYLKGSNEDCVKRVLVKRFMTLIDPQDVYHPMREPTNIF
jgi:hypothetical protein